MNRFRLPLTLALSTLSAAAFAHPGHVEEVAGHSHWLSWGAGAAALLIAAGALAAGYRAVVRRNR